MPAVGLFTISTYILCQKEVCPITGTCLWHDDVVFSTLVGSLENGVIQGGGSSLIYLALFTVSLVSTEIPSGAFLILSLLLTTYSSYFYFIILFGLRIV